MNPVDYLCPARKPRLTNPATQDQIIYRGTQLATPGGLLRATSWTDSLPVAIIWSAVPGNVFANSAAARHAHFLPTSTVHEARVTSLNTKVLRMGDVTALTIGELNRLLPMDREEIRKIFNYLHNRLIGKARGGEFKYLWSDEDGDPVDEEMAVPFSLTSSATMISAARDEWDYDRRVADHFEVDVFALADTPAVQRTALAAGYEAMSYQDVFAGGEYASEELFKKDVADLLGVEMQRDIENEFVPTHWTYRPLVPSAVEVLRTWPVQDVLRVAQLVK